MFTEKEKNALLAGLNALAKNAPNTLQVAADLLPLALKVQEMTDKKEDPAQPQESQQ